MSSQQTYEGGCHCGTIRYRARGGSNSMICHCETCRRVSGAPVMAWVSFAIEDYQVICGTPRHYQSSPPVDRTFCPECGTQLTYLHADSSDSIDVATATLDDPQAFPPGHHSWLSHNISWVKFGDGATQYPRGRNDG